MCFDFIYHPWQLAKIKIEDDGSYVQLSEVKISNFLSFRYEL